MTDPRDPDELIEVASAYLDGEATAEEVALVEGDPELQQVVALLESNRARVLDAPVEIVDPPSRPAHLAAAMSVFDELNAPATEPAPKVATFEPPRPAPPQDLSAIAAAVTGKSLGDQGADRHTDSPDDRPTDIDAGQPSPSIEEAPSVEAPEAPIDLASRRRRRSAPPAWLAAAAGTLVVAGGGAYLASQGGGSAADETAAVEEATDRVSASSSNGDADATEESAEAEMLEESTTADDTGAADAAGETAMADETEESASEETTEDGELFLVPPVDPESAYIVEAGTPIEAIVEEFADEALDLEFSFCFMSGQIDDLLEEQAPAVAIGMIPVSIGEELYEIVLFENGDDRFGVARTSTCEDPVG